MNLKFRSIALIVLCTFFVSIMPTYAFAETLNNESDYSKNISSSNNQSGAIVGEIVGKRQANVKHFRKDDGTYAATVYRQPVHYFDGSEWKDIDNTLEEKDDKNGLINSKEDLLKDKTSFEVTEKEKANENDSKKTDETQGSNKILENKSNDFKVSIAKNPNADKLVTIKKDKYEVSWNIKSERKVQVNKKELTKEDIDKISGVADLKNDKNATEKQKVEVENIKKATASKIASEVEFKDIKPTVDLRYKLISNSIKEDIILNSKTEISNFSFNLNTKNLKPTLKDNRVILVDNESNKEIFTLDAPFMIDAKGEKSSNIKIELKEKGKGYVLSLNLDEDWLMDKDRAYPVIIDPSMQTSVAQQDIKETFVCSNDSSDKSNNQYLRVGNTPGVGITRSYMKFVNLPKLNTGDMITSAQLYLLKEPSASGTAGQVDVHRVTNDWNAYGLNWSNQPGTDPKIEDYQELNNGNWYTWDISAIVKSWYNNGTNYGIMLRSTDEGSGYTAYWSSDISDAYASARPVVNFYYVNNSGLESHWTYHSQDAGRAGTSYVNDYNGNLIHIHNDMSMSGNKMPVSINHIYNSNDKDSDINYGLGWRLNFSQKVSYQTIGGVGYYQYIDEDGTQKYFKNDSSVMKEENGSDLTLTKNSDSSLTLKDKKDNKLNFNSSGVLTSIVDNNNNTITLNYSGSKLISLKDGANRTTTLNYNTLGKLSEIVEPSGAKTTYTYTGNQLTSINYADGKSSTYAYDGSNKLLSTSNYTGYKISYEYYSMVPYRVSKIRESNVDGTSGNQLGISYGFNTTTFTDVKSKSEVFSFDNWGKTTGIKDAEGDGKYFKYENAANTTKLTAESKLQKTIINLLRNHNVEADGYWYMGLDGGSGSSSYATGVSYFGSRSVKINKTDNISRSYCDQHIVIEKGKTYTFSAYVKTDNVSNTNKKGANIKIYYKNSDGNYIQNDAVYTNGTKEWDRQQVTVTVPSEAKDGEIIVRVALEGETGTAYFDGMQLEESVVANRYNLIENQSFVYGGTIPDFWTSNGLLDSGDYATNEDKAPCSQGTNDRSFRFSGNAAKQKALYQWVNVSGKAGDVFNLAGWLRGASIPTGSGKSFALSMAFYNATTGGYEWHGIDMPGEISQWQYVSDKMIAKSDYSKVLIYLIYYNNANPAYFDGIQLYKEEFGKSYTYDEKGNVTLTEDIVKNRSTYQYNNNNDLINSIDPKGGQFKYEYDGKHNNTKATTAENVVYSFKYDSNGNPIKATIGDGTTYISSTANYTASGNYLSSIIDSFGNKTSYNYDETKGVLNSVTDANGKITIYAYNQLNRLTSASKVASGQTVTNSYAYENDRIKNINHNGFSYNFNYDSLGNITAVSVGSQNLITNTYEPLTSKLLESQYGNGQKVSSLYDSNDNVIGNKYSGDNTVGITYQGYVEGTGWQSVSQNDAILGTTGNGLRLEAIKINLNNASAGMRIKYQANIQNTGWTSWTYDGGQVGTPGQGLRIEAIRIKLEGAPAGYTVQYQSHIQDKGWMDSVQDGVTSGTEGLSLRMEALKINLSKLRNSYKYDANSNLAKKEDFINGTSFNYTYDLADRLTKVSEANGNTTSFGYDNNNNSNSLNEIIGNNSYGTNFSYDKDNRLTGITYNRNTNNSISYSYDTLGRIQSKNTNTGAAQFNTSYSYLKGSDVSAVGVTYQASLSTTGWQAAVTDGGTAGTVGQGTKMEQFKISLVGALPGMRIKYQAHVSNVGWQNWVYDGTTVGVVGQQIEALRIQLEGAPEGYHVEYKAHVQDIGWQDSVVDGALAGTTGQSKRLEAIQVSIIKPSSKESTRIGSINNNGNSISYTYDKIGNIDTITQNGKAIKYYYNELNELTREDNQVLNKTITYSYDVGGNITNKVEYPYTTGALGTAAKTIPYSYGDGNWKDKLTAFDGKAITYDQIGNPLTYNGFTYTWEMGRQLKSVSGNNQNIAYKYNDAGVRTEKTVNGVTTKYHLVGDKVTFEDNGTDKIYYTYDSISNLVSMNLNGVEYYYIRNAQGDIIGLFDGTGTQVVSYTYDSWGKLISTTGTLASTVGAKNSYRYRGYRYDTETGLYYLNARYYNPDWGRFINADSLGGEVGKLLSHNVFAYCMNNPVNLDDPSGCWPSWGDIWQGAKNLVNTIEQHIIATVVTAVVVVAVAVAINYVIRNPRALPAATSGGTAATTAAKRMENARNLGQQGEKAAKIVKNTQRIPSITGTAKYRIPDALDKTNKVLTEIKNVKSQGLTNQLKDFSLWAEEKGYEFILKTRPNTKISGPLQEYIDNGKIIHLFIGD